MAKDRLLQVLRASATSLDQKSLDSNGKQKNETMEALLSPYTQIVIGLNDIKANLDEINLLMENISIRNESEKDMEKLRNENLRIANFLFKQFQSLRINLPIENDFSIEARIKITLFNGLYEHFKILWQRNEKQGIEAENVLKKSLKMQAKLLNQDINDEAELEALIANKTTNLFVGNILEETEKERQTLRDLLDRLSDLQRLEKSIEEIHALFLRIQTLVYEQGDLIQRVEYHAQEASLYTDKGTNELVKADIYAKKARKKKIYIIIILVVLFLLLVVFLF